MATISQRVIEADLSRQGPADMLHLNKIILWSRVSTWLGILTMWCAFPTSARSADNTIRHRAGRYFVNPLSIFLLSLGTMTRWAIVGHHVCHGGFDKCSDGVYPPPARAPRVRACVRARPSMADFITGDHASLR